MTNAFTRVDSRNRRVRTMIFDGVCYQFRKKYELTIDANIVIYQ
jgi:hypothetical protein